MRTLLAIITLAVAGAPALAQEAPITHTPTPDVAANAVITVAGVNAAGTVVRPRMGRGIDVRVLDRAGRLLIYGTTDERGEILLYGFAPGRYLLRGPRGARRAIILREGVTTRVRLAVQVRTVPVTG